jgi:hypothetical protein
VAPELGRDIHPLEVVGGGLEARSAYGVAHQSHVLLEIGDVFLGGRFPQPVNEFQALDAELLPRNPREIQVRHHARTDGFVNRPLCERNAEFRRGGLRARDACESRNDCGFEKIAAVHRGLW